MAISLRLDDQTAKRLAAIARQKGISKSELIRQYLARYLDDQRQGIDAVGSGQQLFGQVGSGRGDLSKEAKRIAREKIRAKHRGR